MRKLVVPFLNQVVTLIIQLFFQNFKSVYDTEIQQLVSIMVSCVAFLILVLSVEGLGFGLVDAWHIYFSLEGFNSDIFPGISVLQAP